MLYAKWQVCCAGHIVLKNLNIMFFSPATIRPAEPAVRDPLLEFGRYVGECMPRYVQKVQVTHGDELEIMVHPDGIVPIMTFLKDHHQGQFVNIADIAGVDVPTRQYRFEVRIQSATLTHQPLGDLNEILDK